MEDAELTVENDCEDQGFSFAGYCTKWPCNQDPIKSKFIVDDKGYSICPLCKGSYGKICTTEKEETKMGENNETQTEPKTALHQPQLKEPPKVEVSSYEHTEKGGRVKAMQFISGQLFDDIANFVTCNFDASQADGESVSAMELTNGPCPVDVNPGDYIFKVHDDAGVEHFAVQNAVDFEKAYEEIDEATTPAAKPEPKIYKTTLEAIQFFTGMEAADINAFIDCDASYDAGQFNVIDATATVVEVQDGDYILKDNEGNAVVIAQKQFKMFYTALDYVAPVMSALTDDQEDLLEHFDGMIIAEIKKMTDRYCTPTEIKELKNMWADVYNLRDIYQPEFAPHAPVLSIDDTVELDEVLLSGEVEGDVDDCIGDDEEDENLSHNY